MAEGLCWCASDVKCPHGISTKLPGMWEDMEKIVDEILQQFDRKSIRRYLKKDVDGNPRSSLSSHLKELHKTPDDVKAMIEKVKVAGTFQLSDQKAKRRRSDLVEGMNEGTHAKLAAASSFPTPVDHRAATGNGGKRTFTALENEQGLMKTHSQPELIREPTSPQVRSGKKLPALTTPTQNSNNGFTRDALSSSLPQLPKRGGTAQRQQPASQGLPELGRKHAWMTPDAGSQRMESPLRDSMVGDQQSLVENAARGIPRTDPANPTMAESTISAGLMRTADQLARRVLPWQAVLCPRAVESLQDLRLTMVQSKHTQFMSQMKQKLEEKVMNFLHKKEEEVDSWLKREVNDWQSFLAADEAELVEFTKNDLARITDRAIAQDTAYRLRELRVANELDDTERDQTRQQLVNFRRIVRASKQALPSNKSIFEQEEQHVEVRVLQESISKGQGTAKRRLVDMSRTHIRKQEEAHDWLCSLADNAIAAELSEARLKASYAKLDGTKSKSMDTLHNAMAMYKEQHDSILEAIVVFAGRIHQHASDYLQREQLVTRAFMQYLMGIISGEIKTHTNDHKKNSYAWETKSMIDRGARKEQALVNEFHSHMDPLDRMVGEFKEKMRIQMEHITMKLQSIVNGKENDVNARKALIHKKLAKHVNKACNARRQRLKDATAIRRDEFDLESRAMSKVEELCTDLRSAVDTFWVKEHLRERRIYEASLGRLERLEKSALIIWNKHAHLAIDQREDYSDWLETYKRDRDEKIFMRKSQIEGEFTAWNTQFCASLKSLGHEMRQGFRYLVAASTMYDLNDTVDQNVEDLALKYDDFHYVIMERFQDLRNKLEDYIALEMRRVDEFSADKRDGLVQEWRENLFRLDSGINRRIGSLKDMEADLEETIRLTILQHEVENSTFEQLSCSRYEGFWIDWRKKMTVLSRELMNTQEDYEMAKRGGKVKARASRKDRVLDDLVQMAKDGGGQEERGGKTGADEGEEGSSPVKDALKNGGGPEPDEENMTDNKRLKIILDAIKPDIYRDFSLKLSRSLEKIRRDLGEGRKQLIPPYAAVKTVAAACERFYNKAKLEERCVGRISSRGVLIFQEGLPKNAGAIFSLASTCSLIHLMKLKDNKFDCDDIFALMESIKVFFLVGLLAITSQYGEYGEYFIKSECLWACSTMDIIPPVDLVQNSLARGIKQSIPLGLPATGIFSEDPRDLLNAMTDLSTDLEAVQASINEYQAMLQEEERSASGEQPTYDNGSTLTADPSGAEAYNKEPQKVMHLLVNKVPLLKQMQKMESLFPANDCLILAAFLGRPDGSFEMTTHRICQVISIWRRTSVAMALSAISPPSSEYPRIQDIMTAHNAAMTGKKRMGYGNIACMSNFAAISMAIDYISSIHGLPISVLQAQAILSKGGSCDPFLEDPKQSFRHERLIYEIQEMLDVFMYRIPKSMIHDEYLQICLPKNVETILRRLDLNFSGVLPLEVIRTYIQKDDSNLTNNQASMVFWSLSRVNEDFDAEKEGSLVQESLDSFATGGGHRPLINTQFNSDPEEYMVRFGKDVDRYLDSMPTLDTTVVLGMLTHPLTATAAHALVTDAMKLDPSARNPMPTTCAIWLGQRMIKLEDALNALLLPGNVSNDGNLIMGVTRHAFSAAEIGNEAIDAFVRKVRVYVEVDMLIKYPEICEIRASDRHYGPAGNDPMQFDINAVADVHWRELLQRRLHRLDRLTLSWRDTMLSEWAQSLYTSRQMRYNQRVTLVQKSVGVYHTQYHSLREAILSERGALMSLFRGLENELVALVQDDYALVTYHSSFLDRALRRFEGEFERFWLVLKDMMVHYVRHVGTIKRESIDRVNRASLRLKEDLETSCNGLIMGYTAGYAQGFFDSLIHRGEIWRSQLTDLQGQLIVVKEKFMTQKDETDRDVTIQISDRLTLDRNRCKNHLESLNEDTAIMLDQVANTRASYAALQKDANARLILRIEKSIRESRKLRTAAENEPELEAAVIRDIRVVLNIARDACLSIVKQIQEACIKQLKNLEPIRVPHRENMEKKVKQIEQQWREVEEVVFPLVDDYEREVFKQLHMMNAHALERIHVYRETEVSDLIATYKRERIALILAFRKHFRDYDLSEANIFERFNEEIRRTVSDMLKLWGPSRPKFIMNSLKEFRNLATDSLSASSLDIKQQMFVRDINDDTSSSRMEVADMFAHQLMKSCKYADGIPQQYIKERDEQIAHIDDLSMTKNGDMIRPQVQAVLDLLVAGIEIDADFSIGYENLVTATSVKASDSITELSDFVFRYTNADYPVSIPYTAMTTRNRIQSRKNEVTALLDASRAHLIADHSKIDVLMAAGEKDIEEWSSLTLQLIENAFHNAEMNYLSNLWPTPEPTPRLELLPEDEDRVGKLKALLAATQQETRDKSNRMHAHNPNSSPSVMSLSDYSYTPNRHNLANYKGDTKALMDSLRITEEEEEELRQKKLAKKAEKEQLRRKHEEETKKPEPKMLRLSDGKVMPELQTTELQEGWFECVAPEGYIYYFNPVTEESLWNLPNTLKKPKDTTMLLDSPDKLVDTPRELLMLEAGNIYAPETVPIRVVNEEYRLNVKLDPKLIMSEITEEARAIAAFAVDTATDITTLIYGKAGKDERTIATLLGDRYNQDALKKAGLGYDSDADDDSILRKQPGEEDSTRLIAEGRDDTNALLVLNEDGRVLDDPHSVVDPHLANMLLDLGLGSQSLVEQREASLLAITDGSIQASSSVHEIVHPEEWLSLGLGATKGDHETGSSDGEDYTGFHQNQLSQQSKAELKYMTTREADLMAKEDDLSKAFENEVENYNCQHLLGKLSAIVHNHEAHLEDISELHHIAAVIKPINVIDIFAGLSTSWAALDEIVSDTKAREAMRTAQIEESRTKEGMRRQQMILEHAEDINEMTQFFSLHHLSKVTARRLATDLVVRQIATPKKLAKIWSRQQINLEELQLDKDDQDELEEALRQILMQPSASSADLMMLPHGSTANLLHSSSSFSPFSSLQLAPTAAHHSSSAYLGTFSTPQQMGSASLILDPALVTEVDDEYEDDEQSVKKLSKGPPPVSQNHLSKHFSHITEDGFKSFHGGWIEGISEKQEVYYYNVKTGESSWHLPDLVKGENAFDVSTPHVPPLQLPNSSSYHTDPNYHNSNEDHHNSMYYQHGDSYDTAGSYDPTQSYAQPDQSIANNYGYEQQQHEQEAVAYDLYQQYDPNAYHDPNAQYDANGQYAMTEYDPHAQYQQQEDPYGYYDEHGEYHYYDHQQVHDEAHLYHTDGTWNISEAIGADHIYDYQVHGKPRAIPTYETPEVAAYAKKEGVARQMVLLQAQDRWQNNLVKTQHVITEQKSKYLQKRVEMFDKVSKRVDGRLNAFIEDIKFMQKTLKKELGEAVATQRDLRRLFEEQNHDAMKAEKLSFILESLERLKISVSEKYESAFKQVDKFAADWELIKQEQLQVGDIFDEGVAANLEQCRLTCEHQVKLFTYDQLKQAAQVAKEEMTELRRALHNQLRADTHEAQEVRIEHREAQVQYFFQREHKKEELRRDLGTGSESYIDQEAVIQGYPVIEKDDDLLTEEELAMSFLLTQLEMEQSLRQDYESILEASRSMALELQVGIQDFDSTEKKGVKEDGSWFNKHRETLERHEQALNMTLSKVRDRMNEGYQELQARIEALDYEVERSAEDELFQSSSLHE